MKHRLFAMLILASCAQVNGDDKPRPKPPRDGIVVSFTSMVGGNRRVHRITLAMPAPTGPDDEDEDHPTRATRKAGQYQ